MVVDVHPFALQTVDGQQESLVVLNHQGLVAVCRIQLEGEEQSRINASQCFAGRLALGNEFFVCGSSFRLFLYFYLLFMGDTEEISFFQLLCFQLRIGIDEFLFADAILSADTEDGFLALYFVHLTARRFFLFFHLLLGGGLLFPNGTSGDGDDDNLSGAEVLGIQSRIGATDDIGTDLILLGDAVECFARLNGVEVQTVLYRSIGCFRLLWDT